MHSVRLSILLALCAPAAVGAATPATPAQLEIEAIYARSTRFWSTVDALEERGLTLLEIQNLLG
jgi:hypothetical protein